jgi:hypothetical protein
VNRGGLNRGAHADARGATQVLERGGEAVSRGNCFRHLLLVPSTFPEKPLLPRRRYLIMVPRPLPVAPLAVRRTYLLVVPRLVPRLVPAATRRCRSKRRTHEPEPLSDADSATREERACVMRVDNRARVIYAAAPPRLFERALSL